MRIIRSFCFWVVTICLVMSQTEAKCNPLSIIRDTEIEEYTLKSVRQLFQASGLNAEAARAIFIQDDSLNAFVAGGTTVFVHTGLILNLDNSDQYVGVLAHETGHVVGGHSARLYENMQRANRTALITTILGGVAAVASGRGDVGLAIMAGGLGTVQGFVSTYRISEENSADGIAVDLLRKTGYSIQGLIDVMRKIQKQERLYVASEFSYLRTHPMTNDRMTFLENQLKDSPPLRDDPEYHLVKAKLYAYLMTPAQTYQTYAGNNTPALYARAIAHFKELKINQALKETDQLIAQYPNNPYFYELKGQILFETGRVKESVLAYRKAVELTQNAPLIRVSLAHALIETGDQKNLQEAVDHLEYVTTRDPYSPDAWQFLGTAYGALGQMNNAEYAFVEYEFQTGKYPEALKRIKRIKDRFKADSAKQLHLQDIEDDIQRDKMKKSETFP